MRKWWFPGDRAAPWIAPALLGLCLILIGLLLFVWPELLAFVVAAVFVSAGVGVLGFAWRVRRQVTWQRTSQSWQWEVYDDVPPPT